MSFFANTIGNAQQGQPQGNGFLFGRIKSSLQNQQAQGQGQQPQNAQAQQQNAQGQQGGMFARAKMLKGFNPFG